MYVCIELYANIKLLRPSKYCIVQLRNTHISLKAKTKKKVKELGIRYPIYTVNVHRVLLKA